jgi:hypothetical protein
VADIGLRFNLSTEEVELTVDGKVTMGSGQDVFQSWVNAYNEKHKPIVVDTPIEEPPVPLTEPVVEETIVVDEPVVPEVDKAEEV